MNDNSIGGYRLVEKVGAGAAASIFRAIKADGNAVAAIKVSRSSDEHHGRALSREIDLLSRISGKSRELLRVLEHSPRDRSPRWYAMEYLPGGSLGDVIRRRHARAGDASIPYPCGSGAAWWRDRSIIQLGLAVAYQLRVIHEHGIVHGDLAPGNILLRDNGAPVIIDFGSAAYYGALCGRESTLDGLPTCATPGYAAPELSRGAPASFRSDLYSVGCLWAALVFGSPLTARELTQAARHLSDMDGLVMRWLLEPEPERRCPDIESAIERLECLGAPRSSMRRRLSPASRAHFVGRHPQLAALSERLHQAYLGRGSTLIIAGESGVGKTRFVNEFMASASQRGARVYAAACSPPVAGEASNAAVLGPLRTWLTDCLLQSTPEHHQDLRAALALDTSQAGSGANPEAASEAVRKVRALDSILTLMRQGSQASPLVLIVDDLQWADEMTLAVFRSPRFRALNALPVLLLGTVRGDRVDTELYPSDSMSLERLGMSGVQQLLRGLLGTRQLPHGLVNWLLTKTDGNPLFLIEFSRHLISAEALVPEAGRNGRNEWRFLPERVASMPTSLQDLVDSRLGSLTPSALRMARAAAELNSDFTIQSALELSCVLWGIEPEEANTAANELLTAHVLSQLGERLSFSHVLFRERVVLIARELEGVDFSARMAAYLTRQGLGHLDEIGLARLANLWHASGQMECAFDCMMRAVSLGRQRPGARLRELCELAIVFSSSLPKQEGSKVDRIDLHLTLGDLLNREARFVEAVKQYELALQLADPALRVTRARLWRKLARSLMTSHRYEQAEQALEQARRELPGDCQRGGEALAEWIEVQQGCFWLAYYRGVDPHHILTTLRPAVEQHGTLLQKCHLYQCASAALTASNGFRCTTESLAYAQLALQQIESGEHLADRRALGLLMVGFPLVWSDDKFDSGVDMLQKATELASWLEDVPVLARATTYLTVGLRRSGRSERVRDAAAAALQYAEQIGSHAFQGAALANQAWLAWRGGDLEGAHLVSVEARQRWKDGTLRYPFQCLLNLVWADVLRVDEQFERALALLAELLAPDLHRLPDPLANAIQSLVSPPPRRLPISTEV